MRTHTTIYILFAALLLLAACKKNALDPSYKGTAGLLIGTDGTMTPVNNIFTYSFAIYPSTTQQDTLGLLVQTIGNIDKEDRVFSIVVDTATTAQPEDYLLPTSFVMPAGQVKVNFPLVINRTARLKDTSALLVLRVGTNEAFTPGTNFGGTSYLGPQIKVSWTDKLTKPADWDILTSPGVMIPYVGRWSRVKHQLIIDATGYAVFNGITTPEKYYIASKVKEYLAQLNAASGVPLKSEDGLQIGICYQCN